jgi:hypothetical protein
MIGETVSMAIVESVYTSSIESCLLTGEEDMCHRVNVRHFLL